MTTVPNGGKRDAVEIEGEIQRLAEEFRRRGTAADPESPAYLRTLLGIRVRVPEPPVVVLSEGEPILLDEATYLKVKVDARGVRRYELATLPVNDEHLIAWGRFWRGLHRIRRAAVTLLLGGDRTAGDGLALPLPAAE